MCLYPKVVKNPKYRSNKKNGGNIPNMQDNRVAFVPVGCGMCMECMKQKANNWKTRLMEDIKVHTNGHFVTMTFNEEALERYSNKIKSEKGNIEGYNLDNEIATEAVRDFLERWRKKFKKSVRHWLITELGQTRTERIHLHGIIFTNNPESINERWNAGKDGTNGWVTIGNGKKSYVCPKTINYITKYVTKLDPLHKYYKPKILCSAGIGANYTKQYNFNKNTYKGKETDTTYKTKEGFKIAMPIYWRNKRYTEEEREKLWIQKLDENVRYIGGEKVKADDDETIQKLLKFYQKRNKELGYGNPEDWEAAKYEHERRKLKRQKSVGGDSPHTRVAVSDESTVKKTEPQRNKKKVVGDGGRVSESQCGSECGATALAGQADYASSAFQRLSFTADAESSQASNNPKTLPLSNHTVDWEKDIPF